MAAFNDPEIMAALQDGMLLSMSLLLLDFYPCYINLFYQMFILC